MEPTRSMTQRDLLRVDWYNDQAGMNTESTRRALYIGLSFRSTPSVDMLQQDSMTMASLVNLVPKLQTTILNIYKLILGTELCYYIH